MPYSKRKNPIIFGGVQRSSGVTGGQTLKTLLTQYLDVGILEKLFPTVFGGVQRSSRVAEGQTLKTMLTQYLKGESLDRFYT
ncbi:hypothetical protein HOLleu_42455 [Holothuria leucospilota]|uniref:Uncharacterized protein n=1 Tax=Holothuria leucospilota TaxID=206669 RepID=A0A9Q0YBM6_HOLLE|nr:hypothetical protein HOLleu_42455 [Holothuria leucospilota]